MSRFNNCRGRSRSGLVHSQNSFPEPPLGPLLTVWNFSDLEHEDEGDNGDSSEAAKTAGSRGGICNSSCLASYNWLDSKEPTIMIPGKPPAWTPLSQPMKLDPDRGIYLKDINAAKWPKHPLEPAVRALLQTEPTFPIDNVDLVACSTTLDNILRFVRGIERPFRCFVEVVGKTVFFVRHLNSPIEHIEDIKGYGHTFPEAYTTWDPDAKRSLSHQRVLSYDLAGLRCLVRYNGDVYIRSELPKADEEADEAETGDPGADQDSLPSRLDRMGPFSGMFSDSITHSDLQIIESGVQIHQDALCDVKTRSIYKKDLVVPEGELPRVLEEELPRFWINRVPQVILAYHTYGLFDDISVIPVTEKAQKWEAKNSATVRKFAQLLRKVISLAKARPDQKLELVRCSLESLEVREQASDAHDALPEELKALWTDQARGNDEQDDESSEDHVSDQETGSEIAEEEAHDYASDGDSEKDFTACSAEDCGYCGHCSY